ncbi:MAG: hypothetical protein WC091_17200 [Sulfuricellaceae bacterium]
MNALEQLEQSLLVYPQDADNQILRSFIHALCLEKDYKLAELFELSYNNFALALKVMENWRTDRYTKSRERIKETLNEPAKQY